MFSCCDTNLRIHANYTNGIPIRFIRIHSHIGIELFALRLLITILRTALASLLSPGSIKHATYYGVAQPHVFHSAASQEYYRVFLEIVSLTGDIGSNFRTVSETDASNLTNSGVRLLGGLGSYLSSYSSLEGGIIGDRAILESIETAGKSHRLGLLGK